MKQHSVEKIGGTSMSQYAAVRDNVILHPKFSAQPYQRVFVVSAYGGMTDLLLEHKKSGQPGVFALFANDINDDSWQHALRNVRQRMCDINAELFADHAARQRADEFVSERLEDALQCLTDLKRICQHGHFSLGDHLDTVREMLASIGEAHSAWNLSQLLTSEGVNAKFIDLSGWRAEQHLSLDDRINNAFADVDFNQELPICTGYAHSENGLMTTFDRGYSEMTFSRIAVLTEAREAIIHKEFHLSSADPRLVGESNAVPIGRTNYDVADQLANLGMEAIHPKAAKGLRQNNIALRVKNTFEPEHGGTLITGDYVSASPCVEIIAGSRNIYALEIFDQDIAGTIGQADQQILKILQQLRAPIVAKDINANSITHYLSTNLKKMKRIQRLVKETFSDADVSIKKVAIVSAIGSDLLVPGLLAKTVKALADAKIDVKAIHQSMRSIDIQFVINESDYDNAIRALHQTLVEIHDHGRAICLAS